MRRRGLLLSAAAAVVVRAQSDSPRTLVYKNTAGCEIKADIFGPSTGDAGPVAVWIHGGALISGSRRLAPDNRVLLSLRDAGFRVISIDYRLAPETKLPAIIEDVQDAFRWIRAKSAELRVDPNRIVVCGGSAGGYLTLMTGFCVNPRPRALVSYWGYGDITGPWYSRPDPFYLKQPAVSRETALAAVSASPLSEPPAKNNRGQFYLHCRQQGIWPKEVAGHDPATEDSWFTPYTPVRNVTLDYPPTMLVHGTADTDVPYEQSVMMAARLAAAGLRHQLITVADGAHGIGNIEVTEQERIYRNAAMFLKGRV